MLRAGQRRRGHHSALLLVIFFHFKELPMLDDNRELPFLEYFKTKSEQVCISQRQG